MRTLTLELLRHGPAHNQLLSPLTEYLALCENHSAVSLRVPFEHNQMLYRLRALSHRMGEEAREFQVTDTARSLGDLLARIPGLTADINRQTLLQDGSSDNVTHLRLILSASELALLPFELAMAPNGCPGAGQPLALQPQVPICITREARRIPDEYIAWPKRPKILFAFASPPGVEPVPAEAHLLALRKALAPWLSLTADQTEKDRLAVVRKRLDVVPDATVEALEDACAEGDFTHVHILAHGVETNDAYDRRYGLALHSTTEDMEVLSGERLATILRTTRRKEPGTFARPTVVTLASCNSANVGSVTGVGASISHALHEAGIPMVIASQFPLSFGGSVTLVHELYQGLLWGEDPRRLLVGLRRRLHSQFKNTHDWASVTAYASLPPNFEHQLAEASIQQAMASIDSVLRSADRVLGTFSTHVKSSSWADQASETDKQALLENVQKQVASAKQRLDGVMRAHPAQRARILGRLASTEKREAQMRYQVEQIPSREVLESLERARAYYWEAHCLRRSQPWELVQYLSLTLVLQELNRLPKPLGRTDQDTTSLWLAAEVQSLADAAAGTPGERAWACGNLLELQLLVPFVEKLAELRPDAGRKAVEYAKDVVSLAGAGSFHVFSTRRQILRYLEWLIRIAPSLQPIESTASAVLDVLPQADEPEWDY